MLWIRERQGSRKRIRVEQRLDDLQIQVVNLAAAFARAGINLDKEPA